MRPVPIIALTMILILVAGCAEITEFFGLEKETPQQKPAEQPWQPDRSSIFVISGRVTDSDTGAGIEGVTVTAQYTIACPTSACEPFTERIDAITDGDGQYNLELYRNFWDVSYQKSSYNVVSFRVSKEESASNLTKDVSLATGVLKEFVGIVRDQGKRVILDRGGTGGYSVNFGGTAHFYEYLVVLNSPEGALYGQLLDMNNKQIWLKGYISPLQNDQAGVEIVSFRTI